MLKKYTTEEIKEILGKHKKWLRNEEGGCRADLYGADLYGANLYGADLRYADLRGADLRYADLLRANLRRADLRDADLCGADLYWADLYWADLRGVNLCGANLRYADLDYSVLPLWCGSLDANFDDRQLKQIAYHLVRAGLQSKNASEETKHELAKLVGFANGFHRVDECGKIVWEDGDV